MAAAPARATEAGFHAELSLQPSVVEAGKPVQISFAVKNPAGETVRFLQFVHERPMHLLVVSDDLADFEHIHPEMQPDDSYGVIHTFANAGRYRLYADYTPPGSGTVVDRFDLTVKGARRPRVELKPDTILTKTVDGLTVSLKNDRPVRAGESVMFTASLANQADGLQVHDLQLYLGALAHFVVISRDLQDFIHAHPQEAGEVFDPSQDPALHVHDTSQLAKRLVGPSPSAVSTYVTFPRPGLYKMWAQFQRNDRVTTVPFVLDVAPAGPPVQRAGLSTGTVPIEVTSSGYEPARITVKRGERVKLAFHRADDRNCAGTVNFPKLQITRELPAGQTVTIEFTPTETGEIPFTCGMGMFSGTVVVTR
jgi:plastocyanin